MNLHKDKELFSEIIEGAAEFFNYDPSHIEKDYWVSKMLKEVVESEYSEQAYFKGGTSLSKAYGIISRFSEDLDMLAYTGDINASKTQEKALNKKIHDIIIENNRDIHKPELSKNGGNFRKIYFEYDNNFEKNGLKQQLEVEIKACDFADKTMIYYPSDKKTISPIIGDYLVAIGKKDLVEKYKLKPFEVNCINPRKTICDKISRLVKLSHKENYIEEFAKHIRDFYDLYAILSQKEYKDFLNSEDFIDALYRTTIEDQLMKNSQTDKPLNEAIIFSDTEKILSNPEIQKAYNEGLEKLFFKGLKMPSLEEVKTTIGEISNRITCFEEYRKEKENIVNSTEKKTVFTKISIYPDSTGGLNIRCKADGVQLLGERMSSKDAKRYNDSLSAGNKEELMRLREEFASKYFKEQLENERKHSIKR